MALREAYQKQVALLVRVLPHVAEEKDFALKGGTAINLFVRDFPRLSVDIDLTFLPVLPRPDSIAAVNAGMARVAERIRKKARGRPRSRAQDVRRHSDPTHSPPGWRTDKDRD